MTLIRQLTKNDDLTLATSPRK